MRYDEEFQRRPRRATYESTSGRRGSTSRRRGEAGSYRPPPPSPRFPPERPGTGYRGPGELGRYGNAPVPYGPDHTYDFHFGDRYGYGPDYQIGEERLRELRGPRRQAGRRRR